MFAFARAAAAAAVRTAIERVWPWLTAGLQDIYIDFNRSVGDGAAKELAKALAYNSSLQAISFSHCRWVPRQRRLTGGCATPRAAASAAATAIGGRRGRKDFATPRAGRGPRAGRAGLASSAAIFVGARVSQHVLRRRAEHGGGDAQPEQ